MKNIACIILAAGKGTRMKSSTPKVLHCILGKPVLFHILDSVKSSSIRDVYVVIGHGSSVVAKALSGAGVRSVMQRSLLGSGDAVMSAKSVLAGKFENVVVLCGDTPLISEGTLRSLVDKHKNSKAGATLLTAKVKEPHGYGRILRDDNRCVVRIVEDSDATPFEREINEINVGTYCFNTAALYEALAEVKSDNKKGEYYLTDVIWAMHKKDKVIESVIMPDAEESLGVNNRRDLAEATSNIKAKILEELMLSGVTIQDPATTTVYADTKIGSDTIIYPNTVIESDVVIGRGCKIGPFARIRSGVRIADGAEVGNFVELVRTTIGANTKVKHHTYLGDAVLGSYVNVGAGTITANYDGKKKHKTIIQDGAFVGVGTIFIAPVKMGKKASTGAGSVVLKNRNIPAGDTVVGVPARSIKINKERRQR